MQESVSKVRLLYHSFPAIIVANSILSSIYRLNDGIDTIGLLMPEQTLARYIQRAFSNNFMVTIGSF